MADGIRITTVNVQAWLETTKLNIAGVEADLDLQLETRVLAQLEAGFDVSTWLTPTSTPEIVRSVLAMKYAAAILDRQFSEDSSATDPYAAQLNLMADDLVTGMLTGTVVVDGVLSGQPATEGPDFYPTDVSSVPGLHQDSQWSSNYYQGDPSLGPPKFSMGQRF